MLLALLLACGPAAVKLTDGSADTSDHGGGDTGGDSAETIDSADTSGDSGGDSGDSATDSGTDSATDDVWSGTAAGSADIVAADGSHRSGTCSGTFAFTVTAAGAVSGDIDCGGRNDSFSCPVHGSVSGHDLVATCAYDGFGATGVADVTATLTGSVLDGLVAEQADGLAVALLLDGTLEP